MNNEGLAHTPVFLTELWLPASLYWLQYYKALESPGRLPTVITSVAWRRFPKVCTGEAPKEVQLNSF